MGIRHAKTLTLRGEAFDETREKMARSPEANYEVLESLLREQRRQIRNEDLRTELEYFSEDYDKEQRERVVGFKEALNREGSMTGRNAKGSRPSEIEARENGNMGMNLPPLLAAHLARNESGQPM
ncbi:hypothetical protein Tco_0290417 [Tanacetum coccineum]